MYHHDSLAWCKKRNCELWMEEHIDLFLEAGLRNRDLVPVGFIQTFHPNTFCVLMMREQSEIGWVGIEQNIFVIFVQLQKFLDDVMGVYSDSTFFINRTE